MWTGMDSYMSCDVRSSMVNGMYRRLLVPMVRVKWEPGPSDLDSLI
jgi:hypothetical protein